MFAYRCIAQMPCHLRLERHLSKCYRWQPPPFRCLSRSLLRLSLPTLSPTLLGQAPPTMSKDVLWAISKWRLLRCPVSRLRSTGRTSLAQCGSKRRSNPNRITSTSKAAPLCADCRTRKSSKGANRTTGAGQKPL